MNIFKWITGLTGNSSSVKVAIALFIILFIVVARCCFYPAKAGELHLEFGASALHGYGPYLGFYYRASDVPKAIDFEAGLQLWGETTPYEGERVQNNWAPCVLMDVRAKDFGVGIGLAYLQNTDQLDGSHLNIALKMGYQFSQSLGIDVRHISNAGTTTHNTGRNAILLDWKLR